MTTFQIIACLSKECLLIMQVQGLNETCSCCLHHQNLFPTFSSVNIDKHQNDLVISSYSGHHTLLIFGLGITNCYCPLELSQISWQFSTADQWKFC